jgi:hypothetical protein
MEAEEVAPTDRNDPTDKIKMDSTSKVESILLMPIFFKFIISGCLII